MTIQPARARRRSRSCLSAAAATLIVISGSPGVAFAQAGAADAARPGPALITSPGSFVDPFIGTTGGANESPGAHAPFGMVAWGPDTPNGGDGSGYNFGDTTIDGFSVLHLPTVGCHATGDIPLLPEVGASVNPTGTETIQSGSQHASPGYYSVRTTDGVKTQLAATQRTGLAQFTFPSNSADNLILKMTGDGAQGLVHPSAFSINAISSTEVQGSVTSGDFCSSGNRYTVYFDMQFSAPFTSAATFAGPALRPGARRLAMRAAGARRRQVVPPSRPEGANHPVFHGNAPRSAPALSQPGGISFSFGTLSGPLLVRVGLSFVSDAGAQANLAAEQEPTQGNWDDFATVQAATAGAWQSLLGEVQVSGGNTGKDTVFYTALYHALSFPTVFSDADGSYLGMDGQTHTVPAGHAFYTNFSGWDIYRTQAQLAALLDPSAASDMAQSMVDDYQQAGELPKWVEYNGETHIMVGDPADPILADYYAFGSTGFDTSAALQAMVAQASYATLNRPGLNYLSSPGYLPLDGVYCRDCNYYAPASSTLEYAAADFAVSAFANDLGQSATAQTFLTRAQNWQNLLNPGTGLLQARTANGAWAVDPRKPDLGFAEASPWQYTGMVPFNVAGLAAAKGGDAAMIGYLNHVLSGFRGGGKSSIANMGNEPSIELPWEYDYVGQPYQTQSKVRQVINQIWKAKPNGLAGNDDLGTMSAWLVWAALGLYPMTPGTPTLALGSPLFTQAVITLPGSAALTIDATGATRADGTTEGTPYVQSATWQQAGGSPAQWNAAYAPTGAITAGGTLTFAMSTGPNTSWAAATPPPSYSAPPPAPQAGAVVSSVGTDECLDDAGSGTANGNKIDIFRCNGSAAQLWQFRPNETIRVLGKCLSPARRSRANGVRVVLSACHGASVWQHWRARANGTLINLGSRKCLGDPGSSRANGTLLKTWSCRKRSNQRWRVPYSSPPPPAGQITSALASKCLDLAGGRTKRGTAAVIEPCKGAATQQWIAETDGTIHSGRGRCLDVARGGTAPGTPIDYFTCNNKGSQQWRPQPGGTLVNPESGLCLDLPATTNGIQLTLATCASGSAGEQWRLP